ncbi:MAG TPA: hypothetical protein VL588_12745, partial [Bdellovibrionota bacterium]|nr:hypothetical protein [Bdellovibrionota bacterium]
MKFGVLRRGQFQGFLALGLTLVALSGHQALAGLPASVERTFEQSFGDDSVYMPLDCNINTLHLLEHLRASGQNLRTWKVIYLSGASVLQGPTADGSVQMDGSGLDPVNPRGGPVHWIFHVVAYKAGYVLDMDYGDVPRILTWNEWLDGQFGPGKADSIGTRSYRADLYVRQYSDRIPT